MHLGFTIRAKAELHHVLFSKAVYLLFFKSVGLLIEKGADLNCRNGDEETPLHIMAKKKRLSCIVALISNGADINVINKDGRTSLHLAVEVNFFVCCHREETIL